MTEKWQWVGAIGTALTAIGAWTLRKSKVRKVDADTRWTNLRSMSRIIRDLGREIDRLKGEIDVLRIQNAAQAAEMVRDRQECDENHRKLQTEINRLQDRVRVFEVRDSG